MVEVPQKVIDECNTRPDNMMADIHNITEKILRLIRIHDDLLGSNFGTPAYPDDPLLIDTKLPYDIYHGKATEYMYDPKGWNERQRIKNEELDKKYEENKKRTPAYNEFVSNLSDEEYMDAWGVIITQIDHFDDLENQFLHRDSSAVSITALYLCVSLEKYINAYTKYRNDMLEFRQQWMLDEQKDIIKKYAKDN